MRGSLYINTLPTGEVSVDMSRSPQALLNPRFSYSLALRDTLRQLDLASRFTHEHPQWQTLVLAGSVEVVRSKAHDLQLAGGAIARQAGLAEFTLGGDRRNVSDIIRRLATHTLPELPADAELKQVVRKIIYPFAALTNDDGIYVAYDAVAPWIAEAREDNLGAGERGRPELN